MTPPDLLAVLRRQWKATIAICIVAVAVCGFVMHRNPGYVDTGRVVFKAPSSWGINGAFADGRSLLVIEEVTGWYLMSAAGQDKVRADGGTAAYSLDFYNAYNEEYPNYSEPYIAVTTKSNSPAAAEQTFSVLIKDLQRDVRDRQLAAGSNTAQLSQAEVISAPSGPVSQAGSHKRTLLGFFLLTVIAVVIITSFLDRRRARRVFGMPIPAS
jgi:hypothetical protein